MSGAARGKPKSFEDWECPECANINFSKRTECNRCRKPKPDEKSNLKKSGIEIGKQAAEKSKGLFSADDWMCTKCGNVNWARRKTCNTCNAPKYVEVEERTGYGGGFNEREGLEYKERTDSDGEYDDFGRKKKKFRGPNHEGDEPGASSSADRKDDEESEQETEKRESSAGGKPKAIIKKSSSESDKDVNEEEDDDNDDDDDDDDDDGDTGKYNLFDDDEEEQNNKGSSANDRSRKPGSPALEPRGRASPSSSKTERDRNGRNDSNNERKVISSDKKQARKRYPGSRSSESSSSSSSSSESSSSSSSRSSRSRSRDKSSKSRSHRSER